MEDLAGEVELPGEVSELASSDTTDHQVAGGGGVLPPSRPPRRRRGGGGDRPTRKELLLRDLANFAVGFSIAVLVISILEGRRR